ncbi:hypothetical protein [Sphaerotilus sp.]|uniref:hypothetical protein n=1 Tax=Sphaerotilus sp. TaxID=2093942 RepID=UPI002ACE6E25|nr:hypothetical protein [Sphaerotilus sp.]MDZ7856383.1 hypothetical protein [Sphaerotilus sp.]
MMRIETGFGDPAPGRVRATLLVKRVEVEVLGDVFAAAEQQALPLVIQPHLAGMTAGADLSSIGSVWLIGESSAIGLQLTLELFDVRGDVLARVSSQVGGRNCGWRLLLEQCTDIRLH